MLRWLLAYLATNALVVLVGTALWAVEASVIFTGLLVGAAATHGATPPVGALVAAFWVTGIGNGVVLTVLATLACWLVARRAEVKLRPFIAGLAYVLAIPLGGLCGYLGALGGTVLRARAQRGL